MKDISKFGLGALAGMTTIIVIQKLMSMHRKRKNETSCKCCKSDRSSRHDPIHFRGHPSSVPDIMNCLLGHEDDEDCDELATLIESLNADSEKSKGLQITCGI